MRWFNLAANLVLVALIASWLVDPGPRWLHATGLVSWIAITCIEARRDFGARA